MGDEAVGEPSGPFEDSFRRAPDPDGRVGTCRRASAEDVAVQVKEFAGEGDRVARPEGLHHFKGLVAVAATLADGRAVGFEGARDGAPIPDAKDQPTPRQSVQGGDGVGQADGVSQGQQDDGGAERDSLGVSGHEGEGEEGFEGVGAGVDVLGDPEGVVAEGLDGSGVVDDGLPGVLVGLVEGHAEGEFGHGRSWWGGYPCVRATGEGATSTSIMP